MMKPGKWKTEAAVIVIGGGIAGCSAAYHLAKAGMKNVVLLEQSKLSSGTTWHSAGNMETYREDSLAFEMVRYAVESFPELEKETGLTVGWHKPGRVMFTDSKERLDVFQTLPELGRARGIELEALSRQKVAELLPIINTKDILGGLWVPGDGRVNPTDVVMAYARAAKKFGATVLENVAVNAINLNGDSVSSVDTAFGKIDTDTVVLAAGLWSNTLAATCGTRLPMHALEHFYLITAPIEGLHRDLPMFLSYDDQLYGREEMGGLIVGCLDNDAIPISTDKLGADFAFSLLEERWDQFEPYLLRALQRFPVLKNAGIKMLLNGPESFTPDDKMLLGPAPGVSGLFVLAAMNSNGIALSPAAGRYISEWIVEGTPRTDVSSIDISRFHPCQATTQFVQERVTEVAGFACKMQDEGDDYCTSRNIRLSPLHKDLERLGAHFKSVCGWERPHWFVGSNKSKHWSEWVAEEYAITKSGMLLVDRSSDVKLGVYGPNAGDWLATLSPNFVQTASCDVQNSVRLVNVRGRVQALCQVIQVEPDGWCLIAEPEQETRLKNYFRVNNTPTEIIFVDHTTAYGCIEIIGKDTLGVLNPDNLSVVHCKNKQIGSTLILVEHQDSVALWNLLMKARLSGHILPGGFVAHEAVRIVAGIPRLGCEINPFTDVRMIGDENDPRGAAVTLKISAFTSSWPLLGRSSDAAILCNNRIIGQVTSAIRLPGWNASALLGRVKAEADGELEVLANGQRWPLRNLDTEE